MTNISPTGIPYGVISSHQLDPEVVDQLMINSGYWLDEPETDGVFEGVTYATCWLGGALNFFILDSPYRHAGQKCSPCIPNACDLDNSGTYMGYGVPDSWRRS